METRTVPANMEQWDGLMEMLESYIESTEASMKTKYGIYVSAEEIFTNIVSYAYEAAGEDEDAGVQEEPTVKFSCGFCDEEHTRFRMIFQDRGIPYNPLERPDPDFTIPVEERRIGGLGIYMVKMFMDLVEYRYEDGCNILTMEKSVVTER